MITLCSHSTLSQAEIIRIWKWFILNFEYLRFRASPLFVCVFYFHVNYLTFHHYFRYRLSVSICKRYLLLFNEYGIAIISFLPSSWSPHFMSFFSLKVSTVSFQALHKMNERVDRSLSMGFSTEVCSANIHSSPPVPSSHSFLSMSYSTVR